MWEKWKLLVNRIFSFLAPVAKGQRGFCRGIVSVLRVCVCDHVYVIFFIKHILPPKLMSDFQLHWLKASKLMSWLGVCLFICLSFLVLTFILNVFFSETTRPVSMKFYRNDHTMVLFKISWKNLISSKTLVAMAKNLKIFGIFENLHIWNQMA